MTKYISLCLGLICAIALTACFNSTQIEPSYRTETTTAAGGLQPPPSFAQFKEIPIPEKATMDLKRTLLFGN